MSQYANILVTGASGGLGKQILYQLVKEGHRPIALVRKSSNTSYIDSLGLEKRYADLRDQKAIRESVEGIDAIIHTAAIVKFHGNGFTQQTGINVMGALTLFRAAQSAGVKRFLQLSSIVAVGAVHRKTSRGALVDESTEFNLRHLQIPYIMTKRAAEDELLQAAQSGTTELVIVCPSINIAPSRTGDDRTKSRKTLGRAVLPRIANLLNLVDIRDSVRGMVAALYRGRAGERYILCGDNIPITDLIRMASEIAGTHPLLVPVPKWLVMSAAHGAKLMHTLTGGSKLRFYPDLVRLADFDWAYSSEKARRELGFTTRPLKESLTDLLTNNFCGTWQKPE
ncbi:MAG: NAD-dependent epimerase/dehydratase family protein [Candidatus Zixiibacteriota bacterium]